MATKDSRRSKDDQRNAGRVRRVVTRSGKGFRVKYPSLKLNRMVECESLLERDAVLIIERSPGVKRYQEQAETILYYDGDRQREYTVDFLIEGFNQEVVRVEVKPSKELLKHTIADKLEKVAAHYAALGQSFRVVTEETIRREPLHSNVVLLEQYRRSTKFDEAMVLALHLDLCLTQITFEEAEKKYRRHDLLGMIASGVIGCNLNRELNGDNTMFHPEEIDRDQVYF